MRKIHLPDGIWQYRVGRRHVLIVAPSGQRFHPAKYQIKGISPEDFERATRKRTINATILPSEVQEYIIRVIVPPRPSECYEVIVRQLRDVHDQGWIVEEIDRVIVDLHDSSVIKFCKRIGLPKVDIYWYIRRKYWPRILPPTWRPKDTRPDIIPFFEIKKVEE